MKTGITAILVGVIVVMLITAGPESAENEKQSLIQIALLLDTSNSMDGLIDQAKSQLWKVVNEFGTALVDGKAPEFHVALYEYGNSGIPSEKGYIRMILPLTDDLDAVSEKLFALKTNGGYEYCGKVIKAAAENLKWSKSDKDFKAIFIAGNEPFTQGDVDYRIACKAAVEKGIVVNTIFCGPYATGVSGKWKDGAALSDGKYMNIDQNQKAVHIEAPQDKEIEKLGTDLNKTYVPYGAKGKAGMENQKAQDKNASSAGSGSNLQRQVCKASHNYNNDRWDLVDAIKKGTVKLEDIKEEDLPEEMRKMSMEEKKKYVEAKAAERGA